MLMHRCCIARPTNDETNANRAFITVRRAVITVFYIPSLRLLRIRIEHVTCTRLMRIDRFKTILGLIMYVWITHCHYAVGEYLL